MQQLYLVPNLLLAVVRLAVEVMQEPREAWLERWPVLWLCVKAKSVIRVSIPIWCV